MTYPDEPLPTHAQMGTVIETLEAIHQALELSGERDTERALAEFSRFPEEHQNNLLIAYGTGDLPYFRPDLMATVGAAYRAIKEHAPHLMPMPAGTPSLAPPPAPPPAAVRYAPQGKIYTLSYMLRDRQFHQIGPALGQLFGLIFEGYTYNWGGDNWSKDDMRLDSKGPPARQQGVVQLTFTYNGMSQDESAYDRGDEKRLTSEDVEAEGAVFLIDLTDDDPKDSPVGFEREVSITLEQSSSTSMTNTIEIDVGVKNTLTIGGEMMGASLEDAIETSFNYKDSNERSKTEEQSKSQSKTVKIAKTCEASKATLLAVQETRIHSSTPRGWHGVPDFGIKISVAGGLWSNDYEPVRGWPYPIAQMMLKCGRHKQESGRHTWEWNDIDEFVSWLEGTDTEMQQFVGKELKDWPNGWDQGPGPHADGITKALIDRYDADMRVDFDGVDSRTYESGTEVEVSDVTGQDLDEVMRKHGAVRLTRKDIEG